MRHTGPALAAAAALVALALVAVGACGGNGGEPGGGKTPPPAAADIECCRTSEPLSFLRQVAYGGQTASFASRETCLSFAPRLPIRPVRAAGDLDTTFDIRASQRSRGCV
jgi:hypothetical protein